MTRRPGLNRLDELVTTPAATLQFVRLPDGQLRLFLSPREIAELCGVQYELVLSWINRGLIRSARDQLGCAHHAVPVTELPKLVALAA